MKTTQRRLACGKDFPTTHPDGFCACCPLECEADALEAFVEATEDKTHKVPQDPETHKCECGNTGSPPDVCPYESEINGNDIPCGYCFSCRSECAERI